MFDQFIAVRLLLTLVTLGYAVAPLIADLNATHATNPLWTPHARFHVVWQILSYAGIGAIALVLIWLPGASALMRLWLATGFAAVVLVAFFATFASMPAFGGANYDVNGYQPKPVSLMGRVVNLDANTTVFSVLTVLLLISMLVLGTR